MKGKKLIALFVAIVMLIACFAACGKKEAGEVSTTDKGTSGGKLDASTITDIGTGGSSGGQALVENLDKNEVHPSDTATLKVAGSAEPSGWQPLAMAWGSQEGAVHRGLIYDMLIDWDCNTGEFVPNLATEWEWVDDLTLRLKLREDVTSINGDPFTANDVIYSLEVGAAETLLQTYFKIFDLEKTKAVDDYTVDIVLKSVYPDLILDLTHRQYAINVEASVEAAGGLESTKTNPISGTGPYKLVKWDEGSAAYFERREDYWGTMPYYKNVQYWFVTDATTRAMGLEAGDYDIIEKAPITAIEQLQGNDKFTINTFRIDSTVDMNINSRHEPLNVKEVRQALALATNYEAILQVAGNGFGVVVDGFYSPFSVAYTEPTEGKENYFRYDLEAAKQKLVDAGYPDGFTIDCIYRSGDNKWTMTAEMLQNQWQQIGVVLDLKQLDSAAYQADSKGMNFDTMLITSANPNPQRGVGTIDTRNATLSRCGEYFCTEEEMQGLHEILDGIYNTVDEVARLEYFREYNDFVREYVPCIKFFVPYSAYVYSSKIVNVMVNTFGDLNLDSLYEAGYMDK